MLAALKLMKSLLRQTRMDAHLEQDGAVEVGPVA